ncbi:helix-turn-helix domain-containing protein [Arthrobacter liuii]|uniref:Helix-turn-helix domain-containing protein n=1 Tax=Arthrobacter liuii TaxID=1476996 RepID=A0ABQ2ATJ7_9MICC|nr:helix-turn-helix domain-containing protein [Arthrobacter liuii]GGH97190.1 hypothetical protein GCM10007170_26820 [Arthrobacter liuii]
MDAVRDLTVAEAVDALGITRASVRDLLRSGRLSSTGRAERVLLIDRNSVERLAASGTRRGRLDCQDSLGRAAGRHHDTQGRRPHG